MKYIALIRHAKSSRKDVALQDLDRPLNHRGELNAPIMGGRLNDQQVVWSRVFCSPALRARQTATFLAPAVGLSDKDIEVVPSLYTFNYEELLYWLSTLERHEDGLLVVCHNPAITDLVNFLALSDLEKIPTCGVALLKINVLNWGRIGAGMGEMTYYDYPKNHFLKRG